MKRLLAILLTLVLCLGVFVSCDNSEESSSSEESLFSTDSEGQELETLNYVEIENISDYNPVFKSIQRPYYVHNASIKPFDNTLAYKTQVFSSFDTFSSFIDEIEIVKNLDSSEDNDILSKINQQTFEDNFVVVVYQRQEDCCRGKTYFYGNLRKEDSCYILDYEQTVDKSRMIHNLQEYSIDIVLIPREACNEDVNNISVCIQTIVHEYECSGELIE